MKNWQSVLSRRDFLKVGAAGGVSVVFSGCMTQKPWILGPPRPGSSLSNSDFLENYGPINRSLGEVAPSVYSGDDNKRPHSILWNLDAYLGSKKIKGNEETANVVVIGGGASGLFTAYALRKFKPIVLEQAARLGGNAKGESWRGLDYAIGSAYIDLPAAGSAMGTLYEELGLSKVLTTRKAVDPIMFENTLVKGFWEGETDLLEKDKYEKLGQFFDDLNSQKERAFPLIPPQNAEQMASVRYFDQWSLHALLSKVVGGVLPKQLEAAIEHYCWSTYAASSQEISAAAALNFLAQESNFICVGPGGNACILEHLLKRLLKEVPETNFRTKSVAVKVKVEGDYCYVLYEDHKGKLRSIKSKAVVMSCPKFVVGRILEGIETERKMAIKTLRYRSYMLANLLIDKKMSRHFYDIFSIGSGNADLSNTKAYHDKVNATDFVMANFAGLDSDFNVLTFYNAFPYDNARLDLFKRSSYEHYRKKFEKQIEQSVFPLLGLKWSDAIDLRLTLWGHALPLAAQGLYRSKLVDELRRPFRGRVFFVEQDNWAYPSLQTGAAESFTFKDQIISAIEA